MIAQTVICTAFRRNVLALLAVLAMSIGSTAQDAVPTVTYSQDFPGSDPDHYSIKVASDGHASYESNGKLSFQAEAGEPFQLDFTLSETNRTRIFALAKKAKYFEGKVDSDRKNLASTGKKVLTYSDAQKHTHAEYNYSPDLAVQELTRVFQDLSVALEFGRRLEFERRYQKLALDEELKRMEQMVRDQDLEELQALTPILQRIVSDNSVINSVRARAQRIIAMSTLPQTQPKR